MPRLRSRAHRDPLAVDTHRIVTDFSGCMVATPTGAQSGRRFTYDAAAELCACRQATIKGYRGISMGLIRPRLRPVEQFPAIAAFVDLGPHVFAEGSDTLAHHPAA